VDVPADILVTSRLAVIKVVAAVVLLAPSPDQ
jgi:hypothetical protein